MTKNRKTELECLAMDILAKYQIRSNPGEHLNKIVEGEGITLIDYHDWPDEICGRLMYIEGEPVIYYNAKHMKEVQAFTIAHELGHFFLKHLDDTEAEVICIGRNFEYFEEDEPEIELEVEANYFAASLLLPRDLLQPAVAEIFAKIGRTPPLYVDKQSCNYRDYKMVISFMKLRFTASESAIRYRLIRLNWLTYNFEENKVCHRKGLLSIKEIFETFAETDKGLR